MKLVIFNLFNLLFVFLFIVVITAHIYKIFASNTRRYFATIYFATIYFDDGNDCNCI